MRDQIKIKVPQIFWGEHGTSCHEYIEGVRIDAIRKRIEDAWELIPEKLLIRDFMPT